jgi:type IV pilus assembly protein PilO
VPDLRETRRKTKIALATMALVDVAAIVLYFSPLIGSEPSRRAQLQQLWLELQQKTHEVQPLVGLDKKIPLAHQEIQTFYKDRFPAADSSISENIGKLASETGVKIGSIKYDMKDSLVLGLQPVRLEADVAGDYLQLVRFINALERDSMFFIVDSVLLGGEQGGTVKLQMKAETYLKAGA